MKTRHGKEKSPSHVGNLILGVGAFLGGLLVVNTASVMQKSEVAQTALTPDKTGNLRTSDLQALATNALTYLTEQTGRSVLVSGSMAAITVIGAFAFAKRSENRSRAADRKAVEAKRAARKATMDEVALSVKQLGWQTDAVIAMSKASYAESIRAEFTARAAEQEAARPKLFRDMSPLELVRATQTNQAIPMREEYYIPETAVDGLPRSRTVYWSMAAFRQYRDEEVEQDTGYHAPLDIEDIDIVEAVENVEQRGVHDLMPELHATPPLGHSDVTAAYPIVVPRAA